MTDLAHQLEHWETDPWAASAILAKEILTQHVVDPCTGTGILARAAMARGYQVTAADINDWGYSGTYLNDWLRSDDWIRDRVAGSTVFMNPPFSMADKFVDTALAMGARKVVCFQRFAWYEGSNVAGKRRGAWWERNRPSRIWICGDRATCWLHSVPAAARAEKAGTPMAHAWFVWEQGHLPAAITGHIFKTDTTGLNQPPLI